MIAAPATEATALPREALILAEALMLRHGSVRWARETSGLHLYMASPYALEEDGTVELEKMHLAINVSKYLGLDSWGSLRGTYNADRTAFCMKYRKPYEVSVLLQMPPLEARGIQVKEAPKLVERLNEALLILDENGNKIPEMPVDLVPLKDLPDDHPAVIYVRSRNYDPVALWDQFRACFCNRELPEDSIAGRYYKKMPGGFKRTPQCRIILQAFQMGIRVGWQARVMELEATGEDGALYKAYFHPYNMQYEWCERKGPADEKWQPLPHLTNSNYKWEMAKYINATGMRRRDHMLGFDAAVEWNRKRGTFVAILVEGPLDAARIGAPGIATLGAYVSSGQAEDLVRCFSHIYFIADKDKAGSAALKSAFASLSGRVAFNVVTIPEGWKTEKGKPVKDVGDLTPTQWQALAIMNKIPVL